MSLKNLTKVIMIFKKDFNGFTLIEVLLGLSIFSIIVSSLYGSFWAGMRINARAHHSRHIYRSVVWGFQEISNELQQAVPYTPSGEVKAFEGFSDSLTFLFPSRRGLKKIRYFIKPQKQMQRHQEDFGAWPDAGHVESSQEFQSSELYVLCRQEKVFLTQSLSPVDREIEIVAQGILQDGFTLSYAYLENQEQQPRLTWKDRWRKDFLPASVKISLAFFDSQEPQGFKRMEKTVYIPTGFWGQNEEF